MQVQIEKLPRSTLKITVTVPNTKVKEAYEARFEKVVREAEISGFRKGQAPAHVVKEKTDVSKLHGEVINDLLQTYYVQVLKERQIAPISNPRVEIKEFDLEKNFEFVATVAVRPEVTVGDFKKDLKESHKKQVEKAAEENKQKNAERLAKGEKLEEPRINLSTNEVVDTIVKHTQCDLPEMLVEDERNSLISRLVDQAQAVGLSLEDYLKSQNKTKEQLQGDYSKIAEKNLKAEFALAHLIKTEKVTATEKDIDEMIAAVGDKEAAEKMQNPTQRLYIKSILEKNKLLQGIIEEVEERRSEPASEGVDSAESDTPKENENAK